MGLGQRFDQSTLVVVDIAMPHLNGLDAGEQLKKELPKVKLLYVSMHVDADIAAEAFRRGGSGYLPKACGLSELKTAVLRVLKGERYLSPLIARESVRRLILSHDAVRRQTAKTNNAPIGFLVIATPFTREPQCFRPWLCSLVRFARDYAVDFPRRLGFYTRSGCGLRKYGAQLCPRHTT